MVPHPGAAIVAPRTAPFSSDLTQGKNVLCQKVEILALGLEILALGSEILALG